MNNQEDINYLLIDEIYTPVTEEDYENLKPIIEDFVESYEQNQDKPIEDWLKEKLQTELPDKSEMEVQSITSEIIESIKTFENQKESLKEARLKGRSKESWFAQKVKEATSGTSVDQTVKYLKNLDEAVKIANDAYTKTILTQNGSGPVSQNPQLNGYIAEQWHAQTFNMSAAARGSKYRATVLEPNGKKYAANGVDIEIYEELSKHVVEKGKVKIQKIVGPIIRRYQSKYCKNSEATQKAFEEGNYRGQQSLVPEGQADKMSRKAVEFIESPDGIRSTPLSKERAVEMQNEAQSGKWNERNWNDYKTKDIAVGIGKQVANGAVLGAAIGAGTEVIEKLCKGEQIEGKEVAKKALAGGADFGVKAAITGAVKTGTEKGIIKCIPKGTSSNAIANVVFVGVENAKILYQYGKGDITGRQAINKMEETTVSAAGGMIAMRYGVSGGAKIGFAIGTLFGGIGAPVGAAIGSFIGGSLAYMAGSAVGKAVVAARRKITSIAKTVVTKAYETAKSAVKTVVSGIASVGRKIVDALRFW